MIMYLYQTLILLKQKSAAWMEWVSEKGSVIQTEAMLCDY